MNKPKIVTFSGQARAGKDSAVSILATLLETRSRTPLRINYADYLKHLASTYFGWDGKKDESGRRLLQWLGTEKVRQKNMDFWVDTVINIARIFEDDYDFILIGDCRFENEISRWREEKYEVLPFYVERLDYENELTQEQRNHSSERSLQDFPFVGHLRAANLHDLKQEIVSKVLPVVFSNTK